MTKILLIVLLVVTITPVFAEDAQVMPQGAGRFYVVPGYAWSKEKFDEDAAREDVDDMNLANLAAALEFGVLPWLTAGLKWTPGWVYYSEIENQDEGRLASISDLELGFRVQIVGPEAPVQSNTLRFALTPGLFIPTPGPDWTEEWENQTKGDEYTIQSFSNHVFGFGGQVGVDYVISDNFFISLFGEGRYYLSKTFEKVDLRTASTAAFMNANIEQQFGTVKGYSYNDPADDLTNPGFDLNVEISPHFDANLTKGVRFGASLPVDYSYTPGLSMVGEYTGDADFSKATRNGARFSEAEIAAYEDTVDKMLEAGVESAIENTDGFTMSITPGVSFFFTAIPVPIEITLDYMIPLAGKNTIAMNSVTSQIQFYFGF